MKQQILSLSKWMGLFRLAQRLTASRPRILCYHGISVDDEHLFRPGVFMQPSTFARRMELLGHWGFVSLSLDDYFHQHSAGRVQNNAMILTIDDGWQAIKEDMWPVIKAKQFKATLYLSSYFVEQRRPVFNVAVYYLFWKYQKPFRPTSKSCVQSLNFGQKLDVKQVLEAAKRLGSKIEQPLLQELCDYYGESLQDWQASGKFMYLSSSQVTELHRQGLAIELHTHRHRFAPLSQEQARQELLRNDQAIRAMTGQTARHFCYPSGKYQQKHLAVLAELDIQTATTTHNGLCSRNENVYSLPRIVDNESLSEIEFEAEVSGFMTLTRGLTRSLTRVRGLSFKKSDSRKRT